MNSFLRYYETKDKDYLIDKLKRSFFELKKIEDRLAEALGYPFSEEYGWVIGDHTVHSLLDELIQREREAISALPETQKAIQENR